MPNVAGARLDASNSAVARPRGRDCHVVGIGASAGGLEALRTLFSGMPGRPGFACVVVVHLSPGHESRLAPLLQPYTPMPVQQVTETLPLEPDHVYVIPPNANLSAVDTHLRVSPLDPAQPVRTPVDHFLRTLAAAHDGASAGVILTGAGSDGALGLRHVKARGGLTIVQQPDEAEFDGMPRSAIATGMVDVVAPLRDIPGHLVRFCATPSDADLTDEGTLASLREVVAVVREHADRDLGMFTPESLWKRVARRMQLVRREHLPDYVAALRDDPAEVQHLVDDLTVSVAEFFQDDDGFAALEQQVVPRLFDRKPSAGAHLRAWSIGCSSGEEAYSLAMLLLEERARRGVSTTLQVFASDLSAEMLGMARAGVYPRGIDATVTAERLRRFFVLEDGHYRIRDEVRDVVVFANHDLFRDPPFAHVDLILCRGALRHLLPAARHATLRLFHYALEPRGVLLVGEQATVDVPSLFQADDAHPRAFIRQPGTAVPPRMGAAHRPTARLTPAQPVDALFPQDLAALHRAALERHVPPSVLVDAANHVVHYSARAAEYLRIRGGVLTHDLEQLVREPIGGLLRHGLHAVRTLGVGWASQPVTVATDHEDRQVVLRVEPAPRPDGRPSDFVLVLFDESVHRRADGHAEASGRDAAGAISTLAGELDQASRHLSAWLDRTGADDRLPAGDGPGHDEVRAVAAEIDRSKDELRVVNEELTSLNRSHRERLVELARTSADLRHLLESTGIATLFLDRELRIVRYTPPLAQLFSIRPADAGRPLDEIPRSVRDGNLESDARRVMEHVAPMEREVETGDGRWFLMRMAPYRTVREFLQGVVVSFVDITARKQAEQALRDTDRRKDEFIALLAHELRNPLAPITAGVEVLKNAAGNPRIVEKIAGIMQRQSMQLVRLVDDLLEVSRITSGRFRLRRAGIDLLEVLQDAVTSVRPLFEQHGHDLVLALPEGPLRLNADGARLQQVFSNLLTNAARYTSRGGRVWLTAAADGSDAVVEVRDTGVGMPADELRHIFEMFYRGTHGRLPRDAGLGIGLALARQLVDMHGGTISAESEGVGRGSTFTVRLPRLAGPVVVERPEAAPAGPVQGRKVLIVDDNADAAQTLGMQVQAIFPANEVRLATGGVDALAIAEQFRPDLVLLDIGMPDMDGYEVARRLRQRPWGHEVLLVALTGWGQEEHRRLTRAAGFDRHVTKPMSPEAIDELLAAAGEQP
jgi:two-component system CheB/CheR fusion protein